MLSVIIPLGPHDSDPTEILYELSSLPKDAEIILAVAEGFEFTVAIPKTVRILEGKPGRAAQMNAAAAQARGHYLWFLHSDTKLGDGVIEKLFSKLHETPNTILYHDLAFAKDGPSLMGLNAMAVRFRSDVLKMPFGDQGFCISREVFRKLGGYDETAAYGEDHLLVWKAHQSRVPLRRAGSVLITSARKYQTGGWLKITGLHVWLTIKQATPEFFKLLKARFR